MSVLGFARVVTPPVDETAHPVWSQTFDDAIRQIQLSDDATAWRSVNPRPGFTGWTDDHASILSIINFESFLPRGTR